MGDWPLYGNQGRMALLSQDGTHPYGILLTSGAAHTKGESWLELCASTPFNIRKLIIQLGLSTAATDYLFDLAVGAAGSEVIIINNVGWGRNAFVQDYFEIPLSIPAGTRLSGKIQAVSATQQLRASIWGYEGNFKAPMSLSSVVTYGANTGTTQGATIDPGGTAETKGAWVELTSSSAALQGLVLGITQLNNTARSSAAWYIDIGIGAEDSELVIIPDLSFGADSAIDQIMPIHSHFFPISIPAGTRIAIRAMATINDATDRLIGAILHGLY